MRMIELIFLIIFLRIGKNIRHILKNCQVLGVSLVFTVPDWTRTMGWIPDHVRNDNVGGRMTVERGAE